jgi:hypothetical protein
MWAMVVVVDDVVGQHVLEMTATEDQHAVVTPTGRWINRLPRGRHTAVS